MERQMMQTNVLPSVLSSVLSSIEVSNRFIMASVSRWLELALADGRAWIGWVIARFYPAQVGDKKVSCGFKVENGEADMVNARSESHKIFDWAEDFLKM